MGKWRVVEGREHPRCGGERFWSVSEEDSNQLILILKSEELANQIAREHNAHEELVALARDHIKLLALLRDDLKRETGDYYNPNPYEENRKKAEAVLAQAGNNSKTSGE